MTTTLLVDTSSLTYRAFFALPTSITDPDGNPVNAVRGYLDMVSAVVTELDPNVIHHCWDDAEVPAERLQAYPAYKAKRTAAPPEIVWQFALLRDLLPVLGEQITEAEGWEADDAIGTLAAAAPSEDRVVILTGDRDLIQLVRDPVVQVWFTVSGTKQMVRYDQAAVVDKYGVPASRYVDFASLRGDPSDGLPGVRGVGEKTARRLVSEFPTMDDLVASADQQTPALGRTLRESAAYLEAMMAVVPVRTGLELTHIGPDSDPQKVQQLEQRHALSGPIGRWQDHGLPGSRLEHQA